MILLTIVLFANFFVHSPAEKGFVRDSFIRDNVKPADHRKLTENAKRGLSHLAASGTGFFITTNGYILTNHHVIDGAMEVAVIDHKNVAYLADVIAKDSKHDLALLKINLFPRLGHDGSVVVEKLPTTSCLELEERLCVGETVYAIGYPETATLGYDPKITKGIVSSGSGYKGRKDLFQMDAMITHGNSGGPTINEYGSVVGVAVAGVKDISDNCNYAVRTDVALKFLPKTVPFCRATPCRRLSADRLARKTFDSLVYVLVYDQGACREIRHTETDPDDSRRREQEVKVKTAILDARMCKLKKEWADLKKITDWLLDVRGELPEVREWNNLARDELGLHLVITAEADGRDVTAHVKPVCGFKENIVRCGQAVRLYGGSESANFPVEAILTYEDDEWLWKGELKCVYDWHGTSERRVVLKRVGKK